jgi:Ser/Thr protein kinase RdoA (MazF antagonist)
VSADVPVRVLAAWRLRGPVRPAEGGLINRTYLVGEPPQRVLQWVNPIFDPRIQLDLELLAQHLEACGLATPHLVRTPDGQPHIEAYASDGEDRAVVHGEPAHGEPASGVWRVLTFVPGTTFHRIGSPARATAAGRLVGRFHAAVAGWDPDFAAPSRDVHNTPERLRELVEALDSCDGHVLEAPARELGDSILRAWERFDDELDLPERVCHGDLKISNLRFDEAGEEGVCLVDLDTVAKMSLACEMGDAWRSWCNPAGEDDVEAIYFDVDVFAASMRAWVETFHAALAARREVVGDLAESEWRSLVPGIERICIELAARFCTDALRNTYFREDLQRFPVVGQHNLRRADGQLRLAASAREARPRCERLLRAAR